MTMPRGIAKRHRPFAPSGMTTRGESRYPHANRPTEATMKAAALMLSSLLCAPLAAQAADPLPRAKPESVGMSSERLALIRKQIDAEIARHQLPGAVLAIARRGKLVHFEATAISTRRPAFRCAPTRFSASPP